MVTILSLLFSHEEYDLGGTSLLLLALQGNAISLMLQPLQYTLVS